MASDDASDGFEEETITNEPASDEDGALDDDVEVPQEAYEHPTQRLYPPRICLNAS